MTITVQATVGFLESPHNHPDAKLYYSPHLPSGVYWDVWKYYENDVRLGNASDFFEQNGIEFDYNGDPAGEYPAFDTVLTATFIIT